MSNRLAKVRVSYRVLQDLLRGQGLYVAREVSTDAPEDLRVVDFGADWKDRINQQFWVIVESESFEPISEGQMVPEVVFTYTTKEAPDAARV